MVRLLRYAPSALRSRVFIPGRIKHMFYCVKRRCAFLPAWTRDWTWGRY